MTLSSTPVAGRMLVKSLTAGEGSWQTSPQYLVWIIPLEMHLVNIHSSCYVPFLSLLLSFCCCLFFVDTPSLRLHLSSDSVFTVQYVCVFDAGHVMHAGGEPTFMSSAILEYSVDKPAALGCQIRYSDRVLPPL